MKNISNLKSHFNFLNKTIILNKIHFLPSIKASINNNDCSINNISSTTNASVIKNTQNNSLIIQNKPQKYRILKKIKLNKDIRSNSMITKDLFHSTKNINKKTLEILENADHIIKERAKFHEINVFGDKYKNKYLGLKLSKDASKNNYALNLLKKRRIQLNEKEFIFNKVLNEFDEQYKKDYKNFNNFVEKIKNKHQKEEYIIINLKKIKEKKEELIEEELFKNKRLEITLEKK